MNPLLDPAGAETHPPRLLVVEDEEAIAHGLKLTLRRKGYRVDHAADGGDALQRAEAARAEGGYDLIVLDVRLPVFDGFEICQRLRRDGDRTPILMLTARDQPDDVVYGLKIGADDYMVKPFDLAEFLARVEVLLRRAAWQRASAPAEPAADDARDDAPDRLTFGPFWIDFRTFQAQTLTGVVELSRKEVAVMRVFAENADAVVTRRALLERVWELPNHPNTRVVDNVIVALRKAFEENANRPRHIHSVRGVGYRFTIAPQPR
ncbi:MAG: response regulator transcription factor [Acidobacteriota bacterium]